MTSRPRILTFISPASFRLFVATVAVVFSLALPSARAGEGAAAASVTTTTPATTTDLAACATVPPPAEPNAPTPRLELAYRRFSMRNLDNTHVPMNGIELDMYPLSTPWVRTGVELEAGSGRSVLNGSTLATRYGLFGLTGAFQFPARVAPFVQGRLFGGVLGGKLDGPVTIPATGVTLVGTSAVTWLYGGGIDVGANLFVLGRSYVSAAIGWVRTTWGGVDYLGAMRDPSIGVRFKDLTDDSFSLKLGIGI